MTSRSRPWQIWIDTGGTFTDCLARDPKGALHRAKVLSSSALRGTVVRAMGPATFLVNEDWGAVADLPRGFRFRLLGAPTPDLRVEAYDPARRRLLAPAADGRISAVRYDSYRRRLRGEEEPD